MSDPTTASNSKDIITLEDVMELEVKRLEAAIHALGDLIEAKFVTYKIMVDASADQVALALSASEKAITKAEAATEKRFEGINEFRASLADLGKLMATRRELETVSTETKRIIDGNATQIAELRSRIDVGPTGLNALQQQYASMQGAKAQSLDTRSAVFALAAIALGALGFFLGGG